MYVYVCIHVYMRVRMYLPPFYFHLCIHSFITTGEQENTRDCCEYECEIRERREERGERKEEIEEWRAENGENV